MHMIIGWNHIQNLWLIIRTHCALCTKINSSFPLIIIQLMQIYTKKKYSFNFINSFWKLSIQQNPAELTGFLTHLMYIPPYSISLIIRNSVQTGSFWLKQVKHLYFCSLCIFIKNIISCEVRQCVVWSGV